MTKSARVLTNNSGISIYKHVQHKYKAVGTCIMHGYHIDNHAIKFKPFPTFINDVIYVDYLRYTEESHTYAYHVNKHILDNTLMTRGE